MTDLTAFTRFPSLPIELRLKIFRTASNSSPQVLDLWSDFQKRKIGDQDFYVQHYASNLCPTSRTPPVLLSVSRAARSECLQCYSEEFVCEMTISSAGAWSTDLYRREDVEISSTADIWINFGVDILVPRGFWNIESFRDFTSRVQGRATCVALDVSGSFWKQNLKDYCRMHDWALNGVSEVLLYDSFSSSSSEDEIWRRSDHLDQLWRSGVGKRELRFEPLAIREEDESESREEIKKKNEELERVRDVKVLLMELFDVIEGVRRVEEDDDSDDSDDFDDFRDVRKAELVGMKQTAKEEFRRPVIRFVKLVTEVPGTGMSGVSA
ncbi:uncharacterized protein RSE6_09249 [Rhynchosporium secalis]|uniref:2EXR domain-containing protein n=1 Tax=Rhynchosporium secalis TaxID=38038 RepID=A0A1E1MHH1_RHYSE|nr:uncharacterized protein RSE6_09249 [Rhynchosporium secalis]